MQPFNFQNRKILLLKTPPLKHFICHSRALKMQRKYKPPLTP